MNVAMIEEWKPIIGYEGYYEISNCSNVKRLARVGKHSIYGKMNISEIILKQNKTEKGYLSVTLTKNGNRKVYRCHRLVAIHFIPNPDNKPEVNHKDGVKTNNYDWNLEWATHKENIIHAFANGLTKIPKGEMNQSSKLSKIQVLEIRDLCANKKFNQKELAIMYKVAHSTINAIIKRKNWKHI